MVCRDGKTDYSKQNSFNIHMDFHFSLLNYEYTLLPPAGISSPAGTKHTRSSAIGWIYCGVFKGKFLAQTNVMWGYVTISLCCC